MNSTIRNITPLTKAELTKLLVDFDYEGMDLKDVEYLVKEYLTKSLLRRKKSHLLELATELGLIDPEDLQEL